MRFETAEEYKNRQLAQVKEYARRDRITDRSFIDLDNNEAKEDATESEHWRDRADCSIDDNL